MASFGALRGGAAGLLVGVGLTVLALHGAPPRQLPRPPPTSPAPTPVPAAGPASFSPIVKQVLPAVVSVAVLGRPEGTKPKAMGSGFFVSADGYIVTNDHVVSAGGPVRVTLHDRRQLPATLVGRDSPTDLALLKVGVTDAPFVRFSAADPPQVGDWVIAIGSPFGLGGTATAGIVSAFDRDVGQPWVRFMQIDAPINHGNSGGPAFDTQGRVVGVNTGILDTEQGARGIAFAIPAALASEVVAALRAHGRVARGQLGATVVEIDPAEAARAGMPTQGALVIDVQPGGPAQNAGLWRGDLIVAIDGRPVTTAAALQHDVAQGGPGKRVHLEAMRRGRRLAFDLVTADRLPPQP